jgi:HAMP domain-containing protein
MDCQCGGVLGLLLCTSLIVLICNSITRSIDRIRLVARKIAKGEFDHRVDVGNENDAIGGLSAAVNEMGDSLQSMITQLRLDASRDAFGAELSEAMDMADSEDETHQVLSRAMAFVSEDRQIELLVSDSSKAHLERACSHPSAGAPGCCVESPFSCVAVRRGNPVIFNDSESLNACSRLRGRESGPVSAVCIPVSFMGRSLGVLHATSSVEEPMGTEQIAQLTTMGLHAGARIGTVRAFRRTQVQASTDSMTGLANRRMAGDKIRAWLGAGDSFAFVMADLVASNS